MVASAGGASAFAASPENLRLGKAIEVFMQPDRVVVGLRDSHQTRTRIA
jgi:UDPglucose 6-dehydrogenase